MQVPLVLCFKKQFPMEAPGVLLWYGWVAASCLVVNICRLQNFCQEEKEEGSNWPRLQGIPHLPEYTQCNAEAFPGCWWGWEFELLTTWSLGSINLGALLVARAKTVWSLPLPPNSVHLKYSRYESMVSNLWTQERGKTQLPSWRWFWKGATHQRSTAWFHYPFITWQSVYSHSIPKEPLVTLSLWLTAYQVSHKVPSLGSPKDR